MRNGANPCSNGKLGMPRFLSANPFVPRCRSTSKIRKNIIAGKTFEENYWRYCDGIELTLMSNISGIEF